MQVFKYNTLDLFFPNTSDVFIWLSDTYRISNIYVLNIEGEVIASRNFVNRPISECFSEEWAERIQLGLENLKDSGSQEYRQLIEKNQNSIRMEMIVVKMHNNQIMVHFNRLKSQSRSDLLAIQRDLAFRLAEASSLESVLSACLIAAMESVQMEAGGIYLLDSRGNLVLRYHMGLPLDFIEQASSYDQDSDRWKLVMTGKPIFKSYKDLRLKPNSAVQNYNLSTLAVVPIRSSGKMIGCLNIGSFEKREFSSAQKQLLERLSSQVGVTIEKLDKFEQTNFELLEYQNLIDSLHETVFILDFDGKILYHNETVIQKLGFSRNELIGRSFFSLHSQKFQDEVSKAVQLVTEGNSINLNSEIEARNGKINTFDIGLKLGMWQGRSVVVGIGREIPEIIDRVQWMMGQELSDILSKLPLPILVIDAREYYILFANDPSVDLFGQNIEDFKNIFFFNLFEDYDSRVAHKVIQDRGFLSLSENESWQFRSIDSKSISGRLIIQRVLWKDANAYLVIFSETKHQTNAFKEQAFGERYQAVLDAQSDIVLRFDSSGIITYVNRAYCDFFKKSRDELIGSHFSNSVFQSDVEGVSKHLSKISPENPIRENINRMIDAHGNVRWMHWVDYGIFQDGELIEIQAVARDITEEQRRNIYASSAQEYFQGLVEHMPAMFYVVLAENFYPIYISPQVEQLTGFCPQEFYDDPELWRKRVHPQDFAEADKLAKQRAEGSLITEVSYRFICKNGRIIWLEDKGQLEVSSEGDTVLQGMIIDVTEQKLAAQKMEFLGSLEKAIRDISFTLLTTQKAILNSVIYETLAMIGELNAVDRSYVFDFDKDHQVMNNTVEWCAAGISPQIDNLQNLPLQMLPWWSENILNNQVIHIPRVSEMPEEATEEKQILQQQDILSVIVVPMYYHDEAVGFLGFDSVKNEKTWDDEVVTLLRLVANLIVIAKNTEPTD